MSDRLKDHVVEGNKAELTRALDKIVKKAKFINRWIEKNVSRSDRSVLLGNLLASTSGYLELLGSSLQSHISVLALCTRSIYELNIRLRSLIGHQDELARWQSEAVTDKVQILEGILSLSSESENVREQEILRNEIDRIKRLLTKYGLPSVKQPDSTGNLASKVGQEDEHKALFKLYSKLVHPSSYLVNDYLGAASVENQKTLQVHAQLYAHDTINIICKEFSVPYEISKPYGHA